MTLKGTKESKIEWLQETLVLFVAFFIFNILVLFVLWVTFSTIGGIHTLS